MCGNINRCDIVDSSGKVINSKKAESEKFIFIKKNAIGLFGAGIALMSWLISLINYLATSSYARSCSSYYGIQKKYFSSLDLFQDKVLFWVLFILPIIYLFVLIYFNTRYKSKWLIGFTFLATTLTLFLQNLTFTISLLGELSGWLNNIIDNYITIGVFLVSDIIIAYFSILRNSIRKEKKLKKYEKVLVWLALFIYIIDTSIGLSIAVNRDISDKTEYETINDNIVIIDTYNGKFLTMPCIIQDDMLRIEKGKYSFIEMEGIEITYHEYQKVDVIKVE